MKNIYFCACVPDGGVHHYQEENGVLFFREIQPLPSPMYMTITENRAYVLLRETDAVTHFGGMISFDLDAIGRLYNPTPVQSTRGIVPCHLSVRDGNVYVVNYLSGNVVLLPDTVRVHQGKGICSARQEAPHTHFITVSPDGCEVLCTDLGIDEVIIYDRELKEKYRVSMPAGYGPRYLDFSLDGKTLYCVHELACAISMLQKRADKWQLCGTYPLLETVTAKDTAAAIRVCGKHVYVSIRGADVLVRFVAEQNALHLLERTPCGGRSPRDFALVGDRIFCANENSNDVTIFKLQDGSPILLPQKLNIPHLLCVCEGREE